MSFFSGLITALEKSEESRETYHKSSPEFVWFPNLSHYGRVEDNNRKVGYDLDEDELGPENVPDCISIVGSQMGFLNHILL